MKLCNDPQIQAKFKEFYAAKMSNVAIAKELCVSVVIVKELCRLFGLRGQGQRRVPAGGRIFDQPKYRVRFARLYAKGMLDKEIGNLLGVSQASVSTHRRSLGLPGNGGIGRGGYRVNSTTRAGRKPIPGKAVG